MYTYILTYVEHKIRLLRPHSMKVSPKREKCTSKPSLNEVDFF